MLLEEIYKHLHRVLTYEPEKVTSHVQDRVLLHALCCMCEAARG